MHCSHCGYDDSNDSEGDEALDALRDALALLDEIKFDVALGRLGAAEISVALRTLSDTMTTSTMRARRGAAIRREFADRLKAVECERRRAIAQHTSKAFLSAVASGADPDAALGAAWRAMSLTSRQAALQ